MTEDIYTKYGFYKEGPLTFLMNMILNDDMHSFRGVMNHYKNMLSWHSFDWKYKNSIDTELTTSTYFIHFASYHGLVDVCRILIEEFKVDVDDTHNRDNFTPLIYACLGNQVPTIKFLISKGANPNKRTINTKCRPLHFIAKNPHDRSNVVKALVKGGAMVDIRDSEGLTPLLDLSKSNVPNIGTATALVEKGAVLDSLYDNEKYRNSPLHTSIVNLIECHKWKNMPRVKCHLELVKFLLHMGAKTSRITSEETKYLKEHFDIEIVPEATCCVI